LFLMFVGFAASHHLLLNGFPEPLTAVDQPLLPGASQPYGPQKPGDNRSVSLEQSLTP